MDSRYLSILLLFFSSSLCCDDGTLYLFTQKSTVLEVSITNGSLSSNSFSTNCLPSFGTSSATLNPDEEKIYLSCSEGSSYIPSIATISDDKVSSTLHYKADCLVSQISYDPNTGYLWGNYMKSYVDSTGKNGWYELNVVALDPTQSEGGPEIHFKFVIYNYTSTGSSSNDTCTMFVNGQYSFIDIEKNYLYAISAPFIAQIDLSTKTPELVKKWRIEDKTESLNGFAYSPKDRVLYVINSVAPYTDNTLVSISIDDWSRETVTNFPFSFGSSGSAVMDNSSRYYITFNAEYTGSYILATYDTQKNTTTSFGVKTKEDIRNIVSAGCPSKSKENKIEEWIEDHKKAIIIGCSIGGGLIVVGVAAIFIVRWRRRRHYHPINNHH